MRTVYSTDMPFRFVIPTLISAVTIIGALTLPEWGGGILARFGGDISRADEATYAEVSPVEVPRVSRTASSTEKLMLPILVYHIVRPSYPSDSRDVRAIAHTPEIFDAQMKHLADTGYAVVSFADLESYFRTGTELPRKPVILSFDDGWNDQFVYAFPLLKKYKYSATFFVFTNSIGKKGFLSWDQLQEMRSAGMNIGSHSLSHPYLTHISDPKVLWNEIDGSKKVLEEKLGTRITQFAYPFGQYNTAAVADVERAGYLSARGDFYKGAQSADRIFELNAMNAPTTTELFARKFPLP